MSAARVQPTHTAKQQSRSQSRSPARPSTLAYCRSLALNSPPVTLSLATPWTRLERRPWRGIHAHGDDAVTSLRTAPRGQGAGGRHKPRRYCQCLAFFTLNRYHRCRRRRRRRGGRAALPAALGAQICGDSARASLFVSDLSTFSPSHGTVAASRMQRCCCQDQPIGRSIRLAAGASARSAPPPILSSEGHSSTAGMPSVFPHNKLEAERRISESGSAGRLQNGAATHSSSELSRPLCNAGANSASVNFAPLAAGLPEAREG